MQNNRKNSFQKFQTNLSHPTQFTPFNCLDIILFFYFIQMILSQQRNNLVAHLHISMRVTIQQELLPDGPGKHAEHGGAVEHRLAPQRSSFSGVHVTILSYNRNQMHKIKEAKTVETSFDSCAFDFGGFFKTHRVLHPNVPPSCGR